MDVWMAGWMDGWLVTWLIAGWGAGTLPNFLFLIARY